MGIPVDPTATVRVSFNQRTATAGGTVALTGDVRDILARDFDPVLHTQVDAATPLTDPRPYDTPGT